MSREFDEWDHVLGDIYVFCVRLFQPSSRPLFGYEHGHHVQKVFSYEAPSTSDLRELAEEAYGAFNAPLELLAEPYLLVAERYRAAGNRSLLVGDVLRIDDDWLACTALGWEELKHAPVEVPR